ncbi:MAG: FliA/WhiG family RNA polymerase sigma factor [Halobacteriovoraceae bacterium]|nr:FliA/WhiG family RNA polymerase sigma factor [Halobacteriovoraceae bacterium]
MSSLTAKLKNLKDYRCTVDPKVKDEIIVEYAPLVRFIAQKIAARLPANIELDDLISCGVIGLMDAIQKFDPSRDNKFKTYAEFRIRGSILDELRSQDWVPRSVREKTKTLERTYAKLERDLGRPATDEEMCAELECSMEEFHEMLNKSKSVSLLNIDDSATFSRGDKKLMMGLLEHRRSSNPFSAVNYKRAQNIIRDGIKSLPEKQRLVLSLYYFEDLNLKEIGQVLDVTESRVSQLHTQAILKLKAKLKNDFESHEDIAV